MQKTYIKIIFTVDYFKNSVSLSILKYVAKFYIWIELNAGSIILLYKSWIVKRLLFSFTDDDRLSVGNDDWEEKKVF